MTYNKICKNASLGEEVNCNLPTCRGNLNQNALPAEKFLRLKGKKKEIMLTSKFWSVFYSVHIASFSHPATHFCGG